jgi:cytochrome bd-type quinol oxidase subunit 2
MEAGSMKVLWIVFGTLAVLVGVVWTLQGLNIMTGSAMSDETTWAIIGPLVAVLGLLAVLFGLRRRDDADTDNADTD